MRYLVMGFCGVGGVWGEAGACGGMALVFVAFIFLFREEERERKRASERG